MWQEVILGVVESPPMRPRYLTASQAGFWDNNRVIAGPPGTEPPGSFNQALRANASPVGGFVGLARGLQRGLMEMERDAEQWLRMLQNAGMPQPCRRLVQLTLGASLALCLLVLASLPATRAGPGPDAALLLTATPTTVATGTPRIVLFRATPDTLVAGESFLLEWRSVNASRALLFTHDLPHQGPVPPTGSMGFEDVPAGTYGLRLVVQDDAEPPRSDQATLIVHVAEQAGVVIMDDGDAGFVRHGNPAFWFEAQAGYGNHMLWTYVNGNVVSNWIEWRPDLPACGDYAVSAFIPGQNATTREARYEVYHTHGPEVRPTDESPRVMVVNQAVYSDEWVPLGTYRFEEGRGGYVRLTDATGEDPNSLRKIGFDAVRWQLENRCLYRIFVPLIER